MAWKAITSTAGVKTLAGEIRIATELGKPGSRCDDDRSVAMVNQSVITVSISYYANPTSEAIFRLELLGQLFLIRKHPGSIPGVELPW